jgi:pimeloyl-ACP methyl ester carboxylesterase
MQDSGYFGELGGLPAYRQLVMMDPRGTGQSAIPQDTASYRYDRLVDDVEAVLDRHGHAAAATAFGAEGAFDPQATRAALSAFDAPVLLLAGEVDLNSIPSAVAEFAALFPRAEFVVQPAAGHSVAR